MKMNDQQIEAMSALDLLMETMEILDAALETEDFDKSHEAVSVLLMQVMDLYGTRSPIFEQFYPVMENIKNSIERVNSGAALHQSKLFQRQLEEVKDLIRTGVYGG